jgi:hypothetical protein
VLKARPGQKAPLLSVSDWIQGEPVNFDRLVGRVVLVEVFQVNCPGCFLYALPQAINLHQIYSPLGLSILGIATAFEDFDKNNLENLVRLIKHGEVIGETHRLLSQQGLLVGNKLPYRIPFPVAMDSLNKRQDNLLQEDMAALIKDRVPNFQQLPESQQLQIRQQVQSYLQSLEYRAETFETFDLKGTPSHILVDKEGRLNSCSFGTDPDLESRINTLLAIGNKL